MTLHDVLAQHDHDAKFLALLGGFESVARRFDVLLVSHAPPRLDAALVDAPPDEIVALLLGAIAIRVRLAAAMTTRETRSHSTQAPPVPVESLLR